MAKLSLVYLTYRPGGIDLLGESLRGCPGDWELVVVDDHAERPERGEVTDYLAKTCGLPLRWHGPSKPRTLPTRGSLANAMNTGAMKCSGEVVVFLHDYTLPPNDLCFQWQLAMSRHGNRKMVQGVAIEISAPRPESPGDVTTWQEEPTLLPVRPWVPDVFEIFYLGVPMRLLEAINGVDERGDHQGPSILNALTTQAKLLGYDFTMDKFLVLKMIDHRAWEETDEFDALWKIKGHALSAAEPLWSVPSKNNFRFSHE